MVKLFVFEIVYGVILLGILMLDSGIWVVTPGWLLVPGSIDVVIGDFLIRQMFSGCFCFCSVG